MNKQDMKNEMTTLLSHTTLLSSKSQSHNILSIHTRTRIKLTKFYFVVCTLSPLISKYYAVQVPFYTKGPRGHMVVGFPTTCAISAHHHSSYEFDPHLW
jgi:hypothetical protein